jgi:para-nitrobenzyl esterase
MHWIALILLCSVGLAQPAFLVTPQGSLRGGVNEAAQVAYFLGIPFARAERWKAPQPMGWQGMLEASRSTTSCPQRGVFSTRLGGYIPPYNEDCLNLGVWMPLGSPPAEGWPVMVWIHGGSFTGGSWAEPVYDGTALAARGVMVVGINYRLGPLGYLNLPGLKAESPDGSVGNYGLLDQIEGLKWVQQNIRAFGGDQENVTVFGQSAGAMSICTLLAAPRAKGLFHKAIIMSGGCGYVRTLEEDAERTLRWAEAMGCKGAELSCLRLVPLERMFPPEGSVLDNAVQRVEAGGFFASPWKPHIDGVILPEPPLQSLSKGAARGISVLAGGTIQEAWGDVLRGPGNWEDFVSRVEEVQTGGGAKALTLYQPLYPNPAEAWAYFQGDRILLCPSLEAARVQAAFAPSYGYVVSYTSPVLPILGSFHGIDMPLVFGSYQVWPNVLLFLTQEAMQEAQELGGRQQRQWTDFAKGETGWPRLPEYASGQLLHIGQKLGLRANEYEQRCGLFR